MSSLRNRSKFVFPDRSQKMKVNNREVSDITGQFETMKKVPRLYKTCRDCSKENWTMYLPIGMADSRAKCPGHTIL